MSIYKYFDTFETEITINSKIIKYNKIDKNVKIFSINCNNDVYKYNTDKPQFYNSTYCINYKCKNINLFVDFVKIPNVKYVFIPCISLSCKGNYLYIHKYLLTHCIFYYSHSIQFYKFDNIIHNKYLSDLIVNKSNLFNEFKNEYDKNEVYNLDLTNELKDYENFNKLFKNEKTAANTIKKLISCAESNIVDEELKNIWYNLFYLQMSEVIEIVEMISKCVIKL